MDKKAEFETLQQLIDYLYREQRYTTQLDVLITAETFDLAQDLMEIVRLLPPGSYQRQRLCDQLNSALVGHGWGFVYGTVE